MENRKAWMESAALAFRGYNITNLGRSPELLAHSVYGPVVARTLSEISALTGDTLGRHVDLLARIRDHEPSRLDTFADDVAMIVGMEIAQLRLLEEFFGMQPHRARLSFGYSIGELSALVIGGVYKVEQLLPVPLRFADDCAALADDVAMGILFHRKLPVSLEKVHQLCVRVSAEGVGLIGPSARLSPNTILLLGQGESLERFRRAMVDILPEGTGLRRNPSRWPPLHTPVTWQRSIPNRVAIELFRTPGGLKRPSPNVISLVTGKSNYDETNSREMLIRWVDHPQLLWSAVYETLASGVDRVIHVGPEPNVVPATFARLSTNVAAQLGNRLTGRFGRTVISEIVRSWLVNLVSSNTALLRAPFVEQVILEDWLLAHSPA
jgi:[acyl-carrier-protein] S-malonyltransferase